MKTMNRRQQRQRHQFRVAKQHQSHAIDSIIIIAIEISRPTGHRPTRIPLFTATKIAFYRLHATPIANWPPPNTLNRVAVGIFSLPDPFLIIIIPPSSRARYKCFVLRWIHFLALEWTRRCISFDHFMLMPAVNTGPNTNNFYHSLS